MLDPRISSANSLPAETFLFEFDLSILPLRKKAIFKNISQYPIVKRDISFLYTESFVYSDLIQSIQDLKLNYLRQIELFDSYETKNEKKCEKFLAISLIFQHDNRTMVDSEVSDYVAKVMSLLKRNNLKVRS